MTTPNIKYKKNDTYSSEPFIFNQVQSENSHK